MYILYKKKMQSQYESHRQIDIIAEIDRKSYHILYCRISCEPQTNLFIKYPNILRDPMVLCKGSLLEASKLFYYPHNKQTNLNIVDVNIFAL